MGALETSLSSRSAIIGGLVRTSIRNPESAKRGSRARKLHAPDAQFTSRVTRDDWDIIREAAVGNAEAQDRLFKTHTPRLYRTVYAILRNKEDAEDAVQDSWCRAYKNLHCFEGRAAFSTWLIRIAINSALMLRRRKSYRVEASLNAILDNHSELVFDKTVAKPPNPEQIYTATELNAYIEDQISKLPQRIQATFRMCEMEEFSTTETARALGIREAAVKSRVSRARGKVTRGLRQLLSAPPASHYLQHSGAQQRQHQKSASLCRPRSSYAQSRKA
jgi:RNA polymerase sigma-70 factor, ECF subfamily